MIEPLLRNIVEYTLESTLESDIAYETARYSLLDALGCALLALSDPECTRLLPPDLPGHGPSEGTPIPGTRFRFGPTAAAFRIGSMIRWLDFNDTWLAAEWGHPSDNLGALLACADFLCRHSHTVSVHELLTAMIQAYEIQGGLALENSYNRVGLDHTALVKIASSAACTRLLGGGAQELLSALSNAFIDLAPLRTYRHAPNVTTRKSWAAGDATARGLQFALWAKRGEIGCPQPLSAPRWGLYEAIFQGDPFTWQRPLGTYVMENILFKVAYPAEFHGQTAVEAAVSLHPEADLKQVERIEIFTQEAGKRIIDKSGPLRNAADRDHCLQYMVAVALLRGNLTAEDYREPTASDPEVDALRKKMLVIEEPSFTRDYYDPNKRAITNRVTLHYKNNKLTQSKTLEYPLGHPRRRGESYPLLLQKFERNARGRLAPETISLLLELFGEKEALEALPVSELLDRFTEADSYG